jgi:protein ImuB
VALETSARAVADDVPVAVVEGTGAQCRVVDANTPARAAGVQAGMGLKGAWVLAPALLAVRHEPRRSAAALEQLADWSLQYTSLVGLHPPDALLLEIGGSLRLFGGSDRLIDGVRGGLGRLGYSAVLAAAPTPLAALWLARAGREAAVFETHALAGALAVLPLAVLRWPARQVERLQGMGARRLGDCLRLPRDGFAKRFGRERLAELDRALGRLADPVAPWQAPLAFSTSLELPAPMRSAGLLEIAFERMLTEFDAFLLTRQVSVARLNAELVLETGQVQQLIVRLAAPVSDTRYLMDLLRERLGQVRLEAPVVAVALSAPELQRHQTRSGDLFERTPRVDEDARRLLERLRNRLGEYAVHGIAPVADHRPEVAWDSVEPGNAAGRRPARRERPSWILERARRLACGPGGVPCHDGPLVLERGPERIESGWWDGADVRRDYYIARSPGGGRLWVYHERRHGAWFLHGIFA